MSARNNKLWDSYKTLEDMADALMRKRRILYITSDSDDRETTHHAVGTINFSYLKGRYWTEGESVFDYLSIDKLIIKPTYIGGWNRYVKRITVMLPNTVEVFQFLKEQSDDSRT